jgi:hypothetical protein
MLLYLRILVAEPKAVYDWLEWLTKQLSYPVYIVSKGNLREDTD